MLYLKNSLVNLTIILFSLFFLTISSADDSNFIFPKKKITTIKPDEKKITNLEKVKNYNIKNLPQKNPYRGKKNIELNTNTAEYSKRKKVENKPFLEKLPSKKPSTQNDTDFQKKNNSYLEPITEKKVEEIKEQKKLNTSKQVYKLNNTFLYPSKKPLTYTKVANKSEIKSKILKEKDYNLAKDIFSLIKQGKWNSAVEQTKKIKDKEFKNLVTWLYLKQNGNRATFSDYRNFIAKNSDYPRIGRLRYMAEHKIILENSSAKSIVSWFDEVAPLSGAGEIKLGEAYLKIGETELGTKLIKSGWVEADLSKRDVRYYRKKFRKLLTTQDHLKRADYLAWDNQYWDLKRMIPYLPKKEKLLYNARFILMTNSYGVDKAISDVPKELINDLGLQYNRLKWRTKRNRLEGSLEILRKFHGEETLLYPELWWKLRENITRDLIYEKKYSLAMRFLVIII